MEKAPNVTGLSNLWDSAIAAATLTPDKTEPEAKEAAPASEEATEEETPKEGEEPTEETESSDEEPAKAEDEESEDDEETKDEDDEEVDPKEAKPKVDLKANKGKEVATPKVYKITDRNGNVVEIDDNTSIKMQVDGKFVRVPVKDLKQDYNGRKAWDSRLQEATKLQKETAKNYEALQTYTQNLKANIEGIGKGFNEGDIFKVIEALSEIQGVDPVENLSLYIDGMNKFYTEYASKPEAERVAFLATKRMGLVEKKANQRVENLTKAQEREKIAADIAEAKAKHGISQDELSKAFEVLAEERKTPEEINKISLPDVVGLVLSARIVDNINEAAKEVGITLSEEDQRQLHRTFYSEEIEGGNPLELSDYVEILSTYANKGKKPQPTVSRKASDKDRQATPKKENKPVTAKSIQDLWDIR